MRRITVGVVDIGEAGKKYVNDALDSNRLSAGKYTRAFEAGFALRHDCRHARGSSVCTHPYFHDGDSKRSPRIEAGIHFVIRKI